MTISPRIGPARPLDEQPGQGSPDLLGEVFQLINRLMWAEADAVCRAAYADWSRMAWGRRLAGCGSMRHTARGHLA